ncbi:predicted protein [Naegleria gruberi]|uniref:Predicted protein n=1 Tax=Naegleria gruberi TaxID=5762 RepID=D2VZC2_NAEGR|nr:uncharacterized protein NAEGRDRAFT_74439 [Naegleria gruberi]EFC37766.1 predicted protein [Naegleria gruberi]|eukprot:XP_002670510.1 predicted protein [Naegleria gruberi strain NEG-M]
MDPISTIFCRNPSKEAFLMFLQERIHQHTYSSSSNGLFSKRLDVDSIRELRNKFIEKTFLKASSSSSLEGGARVTFPSSLKTREKKTDFLLQICNMTIENNLKDENVANYSDKFFGSFLKCSLATLEAADKVSLPLSIQETSVEKDITIAKRIIGACYRNVLILYFIQIIFASGVSSISQQQQVENPDSSSNTLCDLLDECNCERV